MRAFSTPIRESLSPGERVRLALEHQTTDRIPIAMVCAGINLPAREAFESFLKERFGVGVDDYLEPLLDIRTVAPRYIGPPMRPGFDIWGVGRASMSYGSGSYNEISHYPLAQAETPADLEKHLWPTTDWFDYDSLPERCRALRQVRDSCLMVMNGNIFESSWYMRGFERMFLDFVDNPELSHALLQRVTSFWTEHFEKILQAAEGEIDLVFTADDIGGQNGLLLSLPMWEEFIKPCHLRMNATIHEFGARVIYHTDGSIMKAVPGLIEMGIDVLQALQFSAVGMDPVRLKSDFGNQLCFEGGICVQHTLPHGSSTDVEQEVRDRIDVLGRNGGYILGPSHAIQAGTPPENIYALFETARSYYPH